MGVFWLAGLLLAFTPCVLPMVPILSSLIAGQSGPVSRRKGFGLALAYSLAGSVLFFVVTNFGAWLSDPAYPKTAAGLAAAYVAGIPFFQWTVLGTLVYAALLFGGFELLRNRMPALRPQTV